jgi:ribosomal protein S18 acetylase RimI-like enzyme
MRNLTLPAPPAYLTGFAWRPARYEDIPPFQEMLAANQEIDRTESIPSAERLHAVLGMLGDQLDTNTLIAIARDGTIAAEAIIVFPPGEGEALALTDGHVHVRYRGRGLGNYLLEWLERRARLEFSATESGAPQLMRTSCTGHQTDRIALFEQHGFQAMRYSYRMQRSLAEPVQEKPLPASLRWVQWAPELDLPLMHTFNAAFSEHWGLQTMNEEAWQEFFTGVPQFRGDLTYLAMEADNIVGFCVNWVEAAQDGREGWIEAIGVIPAWRGRGIASALLVKSLGAFQAEGLDRAGLDVDAENPTGALRLYQKHGFRVVKDSIHFVKPLN